MLLQVKLNYRRLQAGGFSLQLERAKEKQIIPELLQGVNTL
jgi:hypothetical protein